MPAPTGQSCSSCRFWTVPVGKTPRGLCQRFPPSQQTFGAFPMPMAGDWCGEWRPVAAVPLAGDDAAQVQALAQHLGERAGDLDQAVQGAKSRKRSSGKLPAGLKELTSKESVDGGATD